MKGVGVYQAGRSYERCYRVTGWDVSDMVFLELDPF